MANVGCISQVEFPPQSAFTCIKKCCPVNISLNWSQCMDHHLFNPAFYSNIIKSSISVLLSVNQSVVVGVSNTATKTVAWVVATSHHLNFCWALCETKSKQCFVFIKALWETEQGHFYFEKPCASKSSLQNNWSSPSQFRLVGHRSPPGKNLTI